MGIDGPSVVMLHGLLTGSHASWRMTVAPALAVDHRVVLYDLRGHGFSGRPTAGYRLDDHVDDLGRVLGSETTSSGESVHLVGHSYGALVATSFAATHPRRVRSLTLIDPPFGRRAERFELPRPSPTDLRRHGIGWAETSLAEDLDAEPVIPVEVLQRVACPVSAVFGTSSPYLDSSRMAIEAWGESALHRIDGGHSLHVDAPEAVLDRIRDSIGYAEGLGDRQPSSGS